MAPGRIVVGVDFSATAASALGEARTLATRLGSVLEVVHVREGRSSGPWTPDTAARAWLEGQGLAAADLAVRDGTPWVELVRLSRSPGAELLVLGTHGRGGIHPLGLGTTAARVVLSSSRPVLFVGGRRPGGASGDQHDAGPREARPSRGSGVPSGSTSSTRSTELTS